MSKTTARTAGLIKRVAEATIRKHAASPLTSTPEFWERIVSTVLEEAAAPDLLEVAHMIDAWGNGLRHPTEHERKTVNAARAAIAKAEGLKVMTDSKTSTTETEGTAWIHPDADALVIWNDVRGCYQVKQPDGQWLRVPLDNPYFAAFRTWGEAYMAALELLGFPDCPSPEQDS